ncbi:MAG: TonB-dependent receptor, partial [Bacteroidales bacterium]|nr:TonB-dependent receptor [Bacteroidales bacterium]
MKVRALSIALALTMASLCAYAQGIDTVAHLDLEKSVITEKLNRPMIENLEGISGSVNVEKIRAVPSFLGNSDPIRFARLLPSIQVNTESDGGLYMQGSDYSHTILSIGGVPVYGGSHLLGMFSVFNATHYKAMDYSTSAGQASRLGGSIDMQLQDTVPRRFSGELSAGLISAQGTLSFPTGKHSGMILSARRSYINLLYGRWLKFNDEPIVYNFTDGNLTWYWKA